MTMSEPDEEGWITVGPDPQDQDEEMEEEDKVDLEKLLAQNGQSFQLKFNTESSRVQKVLWCKLEASPSPEVPGNKSMALTGIPPWATTASIKGLLEEHCKEIVKAVYFVKSLKDASQFTPGFVDPSVWPPTDVDGSLIRGFKSGLVVFEKAAGCRSAATALASLPSDSEPLVLSTPERPVATGLKKWKREYNARLLHAQLDMDNLADNIKNFVAQMDAAREAARSKAAADGGKADDEGWITVSRATTKRKPLGLATKTGQAKAKARDAKRKKRKQMLDFYKFQTKDEKLDRLKELKDRFQVDKEKQLKLKQDRQQRKFNS